MCVVVGRRVIAATLRRHSGTLAQPKVLAPVATSFLHESPVAIGGTTEAVEPKVEIIGVYTVPEERWTHDQPVYLVEVRFRGATPFNAGKLGQETPGTPEEDWQVAYDERELDALGEREVAERPLSYDYEGDVRLAFFLHLVDFERPVLTPFGDVRLPSPTDVPPRLAWLEYEPSD